MAAIISAPRELGTTDGLDPRLLDVLKDHLSDSVDPEVRESGGIARFAIARLNTGRADAVATLRKMTSTPAALRDWIVRASA